MEIPDYVVANTEAELRDICTELKQAAMIIADDEEYTNNREQALASTRDEEFQEKMEEQGNRKNVVFVSDSCGPWFLTIVCTKSDRGRTYHVSISGTPISPEGRLIFMGRIAENIEKQVMDIMCDEWEPIRVGSTMEDMVSHYIGD